MPTECERLLEAADEAIAADDFAEARGIFIRVGETWSRSGHFVKAIAIYRHAYELDMLDVDIPNRIVQLCETIGLTDVAAVWARCASRSTKVARDWPFVDANARNGRIEPQGGKTVLTYADSGRALAELEYVGSERATCRPRSPFDGLPEPMLLALLANDFEFTPREFDLGPDEDDYEAVRIHFLEVGETFELRHGGHWAALDRVASAESRTDSAHEDLASLLDLADSYLAMGLLEDARDAYLRVLRSAPDDMRAKDGLKSAGG